MTPIFDFMHYLGVKKLLDFVSDNYFDCITNNSILEIGPGGGCYTSKILEKNPKFLTCVDAYEPFVKGLTDNFGHHENFTAIYQDITNYLTEPKYFDVVICFGVLYHLASPVDVYERIFNYCKPKYFIVDIPGDMLAITEERNFPGDRQTVNGYIPSGINIKMPLDIHRAIPKNYGYTLVKEHNIGHFNVSGKTDSNVMLFSNDK